MKLLHIIGLGVFLAVGIGAVQACKLELTRTHPSQPAIAGTEDILLLQFTPTHRRCNVPVDATRCEGDGVQILGATPWRKDASGKYSRKLKVRYEQTAEAVITTTRVCPKGGEKMSTVIPVQAP